MGSLRKISIEGFKSIRKCELELGQLNVLIGGNGAGKTNFISAFELLQNIINKELQFYSIQNSVSSLLYKGIQKTDSIKMVFDFGHDSYGFSLSTTNNGQLFFRDEYFTINGIKEQIESSRGSLESRWEIGIDDKVDDFVKDYLGNCGCKQYHFHDTSRTARVKHECDVHNNVFLMSDAGNLAAFLLRLKTEYPDRYSMILDTVRLVAPFISDFVLIPYGKSDDLITFRWKQKGCEDIFGPSQLSDGTIRFICLATLLLQPTKLLPPTIIIDEPELGLHPYAIVVLSSLIRNAQKKVQIIISTQSVDLINEFDVEDIVVVETGDDETTFNRLNSKDLGSWLDDYSLGELWKKNIIGGRPR